MTKIRVLIADDHGVLRAGLRMLLNAQADMEVVGEASDVPSALLQVETLKPHIVLMDITMPGESGIRAIGDIRARAPQTRILILTMHDDLAYVRSVMAAGASGYLIKKAPELDLLTAIRAVHLGRTFIDTTVTDIVAEDILSHEAYAAKARPVSQDHILSQREHEVLCLVAQGYMNREIATRLSVSVKSVETYRSRISEKLGLRSRADFVRYALECGLLAPGQEPPSKPE